jgi:hypothetical protein
MKAKFTPTEKAGNSSTLGVLSTCTSSSRGREWDCWQGGCCAVRDSDGEGGWGCQLSSYKHLLV